MKNEVRLIIMTTGCTDPYVNLAAEEYLTRNAEDGTVTLFLWQNARTVVIGKNQNPWRECDIAAIERDGVRLARRISGGGAVYHDMGNLNFTFIARDGLYDIERQTDVILRACRLLGVNAQKNGRNDLTVDGRKFSGHAYWSSGGCNYHHGTIMMDVNAEDLTRYLNVPDSKLRSKGVSSVRSRVTNLKEHIDHMDHKDHMVHTDRSSARPGKDTNTGTDEATDNCADTLGHTSSDTKDMIAAMKDAMIRAASKEYGAEPEYRELPDIPEDLLSKYASEEWRLGTKIPFEKEIVHRFEWGEVQVLLSMKGGYIDNCKVYSDSLETGMFEDLEKMLKGCRYDAASVRTAGRLGGTGGVSARTREVLELIAEQI